MQEAARFQVTELPNGTYAVKDTRDQSIWTKGYVRRGWAISKAIQLNEAHGNRKY